MIQYLSKKLAILLAGRDEEQDVDVYAYGIEILLSSFAEIGTLLLTGALLKKFTESIMYLLIMATLRKFTGGYHASSYLKCNMVFIFFFGISLFFQSTVVKYYQYQKAIMIFVGSWVGHLVFKYAPVKNAKKQMTKFDIIRYNRVSKLLYILLLMTSCILYSFKVKTSIYIISVLLVIGLMMLIAIKGGEQNE